MIPCRQCGHQIELNAKFCPECGAAVSPADVEAVVRSTANSVADGQRLFGEGKISEALVLSDSALLRDPDNVPALALKGDCLERQGDVSGALDCYEHVVTLRPDSPLDRIRVVQLRRAAASGPVAAGRASDRRFNILAGAAATVLLASAGTAVVFANNKDKPSGKPATSQIESQQSRPFLAPAPVPMQERPEDKKETEAAKPPTETAGPGADEASKREAKLPVEPVDRRPSAQPGERRPVSGANTLPDPDKGFQPVSPNVEAIKQQPTKQPDQDPDPQPVKPDEKQPASKPGRQPIIDIKPSTSGGGGSSVGGSQTRDSSGNEATSLIRVARQYFLSGDYEKAAKAYEKALRAGVSPASANHRLAQCYVNLGRRADALGAYQRALAAYQRMLDHGSGDKRLVESYMEECRQAIKLLQ